MRLEELVARASGAISLPSRHNPSSLQCKGKRIKGAENLGEQTAVTVGYLPLVERKGADARS
jgi:hypothetical protein